jgi:hypothetical protein
VSNGPVYEPSLEASEDRGLLLPQGGPEAMRQLVGLVEVRRTLGDQGPTSGRSHLEVAAKVAAEWEALKQGPSLPDSPVASSSNSTTPHHFLTIS